MPPKKKSPKKKRKSRTPKSGEGESLQAQLTAKLEEVTKQYESEVAYREKLGRDRVARMEVLAALEAELELKRKEREEALERDQESHEERAARVGRFEPRRRRRRDPAKLREETRFFSSPRRRASELEAKIDDLGSERASLEVELGALDLAVLTNERLRHEVFEARSAFEKEDAIMVRSARVRPFVTPLRVVVTHCGVVGRGGEAGQGRGLRDAHADRGAEPADAEGPRQRLQDLRGGEHHARGQARGGEQPRPQQEPRDPVRGGRAPPQGPERPREKAPRHARRPRDAREPRGALLLVGKRKNSWFGS